METTHEFKEVQPMTMVVLPQSKLDAITASLEEMKNLIRGKAKEEVGAEWIESTDARKLLGVSQRTWQSYRDERRIPFSQFGRKIYVKRSDIESFLQSHTIKN